MIRDYLPSRLQAEDPLPPLGKRIIAFYAEQFAFIKRMKRFLWISAILFLFALIAGIVFFKLNPELTTRWMSKFRADIVRRYPKQMSPWSMFLSILTNNFRVASIMCLSGLVPFFLPSAIAIIANSGALSLVLAYSWSLHEPVVFRFTTLVLPHGIVELPTMIFVAGFSLYLSAQMTKRIFRKKRTLPAPSGELFSYVNQDDVPDRLEAIGDIAKILAGVILPLVLIAALLETFVTPFIYRLLT